MKTPALAFERPRTVEEAVAILTEQDGEARIIAGGQSLMPMLNLRMAYAPVLVDIGAIDELRQITDENDSILIGSYVTHSQMEDGAAGHHWAGMPNHVAKDIAYRAVRNRGTVGGSLAHADPAADWPVALMALGGEVEISGPEGTRTIPLDEFFVGMLATALEPGEMIRATRLPKGSANLRWSYRKMRKKAGALGEAIVAVVHDPDRDFLRVVAGSGALGGAKRLTQLEDTLASGEIPGQTAIRHALETLVPDLERYDRQIHAVSLGRAIDEAFRDRA